jgi:uracil-DNA glycosylase family 4
MEPFSDESNLDQKWTQLNEEILGCRKCPRLVAWREEVARTRRKAYRDETYWGKPITGFGDKAGRILVVGLAPGAHGANRTGRIFTGDGSGEFLFRALYQAGFANQPTATSIDDGLCLEDLYISAVCRCVPPGNKPNRDELANCLPYLEKELAYLTRLQVIVVLGHIAFDQTLRLYKAQGYDLPRLKFAHGAIHDLGESLPWLVASYHPSRQNTQTGRLNEAMFAEIWEKARSLLKAKD